MLPAPPSSPAGVQPANPPPFLAAAVHELRTPLNSILGFTGSLLMRLPGPLSGQQQRQLVQIERAAKHMLALVDELLELARSESAMPERAREPLVVQEVVQAVLELLEPLAQAKGLQLGAGMPAQALVLSSDRRALTQILLNLVGNALKFTQAGAVRVELEPRADGMALAVVDNGCGIADADLARLFQPFERLHSGTAPGSGLGLYQAQRLAQQLGGSIRCTSSPGQGSRFELRLHS